MQSGLVAPWGEYRRCVEDVGRQRVELGELEFAPGDRILVVGRNDCSLGLVKGMRGTVVEAWINGALVVEPTDAPGRRQIIPASYDGVAHGYAMTAHRAQGITVDISLVHGSDAADRQWQYVALSRHRMRCRYFDVATDRDVDGVHHGHRTEPTIKERLIEVMSRESRTASTIDYPAEYQRRLRFEHAERGPRGGLHARPTLDQMNAMVHSSVEWRLPAVPTWVHTALLLEQHGSSVRPLPRIDVREELGNLGLGAPEAEAVIAGARREVEQAPHSHSVPYGYGPYYQARLHRELWNEYGTRVGSQPRTPVVAQQSPSRGGSLDRQQARERERRRHEQLQRDRERSRQRERNRGPSRGVW